MSGYFTEIDGCSEIVDIRNENIFFSLLDELIEESRVVESLENISVTWRIPIRFSIIDIN